MESIGLLVLQAALEACSPHCNPPNGVQGMGGLGGSLPRPFPVPAIRCISQGTTLLRQHQPPSNFLILCFWRTMASGLRFWQRCGLVRPKQAANDFWPASRLLS